MTHAPRPTGAVDYGNERCVVLEWTPSITAGEAAPGTLGGGYIRIARCGCQRAPSGAMAEILVLDAMGVLYQAGDDVAELLVPFVRQRGTRACRRGHRPRLCRREPRPDRAGGFWTRMGVDAGSRTTISPVIG